jgi:hypothetical protein
MSMSHPDEHTLELFAIGSRRLGTTESEVRNHIAECPHCRRIVEEQQGFYEGVGDVLKSIENVPAPGMESRPGSTLPSLRRMTPLSRVPDERLPFHQDAAQFMRHHPWVSSGGGLAALALIGWLVLSPRQTAIADRDPSHLRINLTNSSVEVFNKSDQPIWSAPAAHPQTLEAEVGRGLTIAEIVDINGDGRHEVASMVQMVGDNAFDDQRFPMVRLYSGDKTLISTVRLGHQVSFGNLSYPDQFGHEGLASVASSDSGTQLLVAMGNHFRSPSVVTVIGKEGNVVSEYWHYGHLSSPVAVRGIMGEDRDLVLVFGQNDAADSVGIQYQMMAVLDPRRMNGMTESHLSRGFGYPTSAGEIAYVKFPEIDLVAVDHEPLFRIQSIYRGNGQITVVEAWKSFQIEYVFSLGLTVLSVRPLQGFAELHARRVKEGKIHSTYGKEYLDNLRQGVRFWNGKEWSKEAVTIRSD